MKLGSWGNIAMIGCGKPWTAENKVGWRIRCKALIFFGSTGFCIKAKTGGKAQRIHPNTFMQVESRGD
ncbi:hypothetical protein KKA95_02335 [Patescibacteria group bacterium]|nr:hypothetical protein [Patescibacteria group bacterium]